MPNRTPLLLALALLLAFVSSADTSTAQERTMLVLSGAAEREVEQDTLVAIVAARAQAPSALEAQERVNTTMTAATERSKIEGVRRSTAGYHVYQERLQDGRPGAWIAEQSLRLEAEDSARLLELVGALQADGLLLHGLSYQLGAATRRALESELAVEAVEVVRSRAERVAEAMDMRVFAIERVRIGEPGRSAPGPMLRTTMAEAASTPPPVALPGRETVSMSVEAEIALGPR